MLVDTSIWVDHLRHSNRKLTRLLTQDPVPPVCCHPFVIGELACGSLGLGRRSEILGLLGDLPQLQVLGHDEVLAFIEAHQLMGRGLGWVDMHLLGAATIAGEPIWTRDRKLEAAASSLDLSSR